MMHTRKGAVTVALGAVVALVATACSGSSSTPSGGASSGAAATKGGTLYVLSQDAHNGLDPQQSYVGADLEFMSRVYARSLTTYSADSSHKLIGDLATDTGTVSNGGKTWKFTIVSTAKWQDGKTVTCEDIRYGISRTFATDVISSGPTYILNYLDVPSDTDGSSLYKGPYGKSSAAAVADFNKAIDCSGQTMTFTFKKPWSDFNLATASLGEFDAARQDKDKGTQSLFAPFSNGPYMLQGTFDPNTGGTFVRNTYWDESTDPVRKAYPDTIKIVQGVDSETIYQRLLADSGNDQAAMTFTTSPASILPQIASTPSAADRTINPAAPYVDYIAPNVTSTVMKNPAARQALAMATNRDAYVTANGGSSVMEPSYAMCNKKLACYKDFNPFGAPTSGDADGAKKVLQAAGFTLPVNITVAYRNTATRTAAFSALKQTWDQAGFNVTLKPIANTGYYRAIASPAQKSVDAFYSSWAQDWPSGSTVLPPLFDGRVNITATSTNSDYGYYNNTTVEKMMDAAYELTDATAREKAWGDIDEAISKDGGAIPLINQKFVFLRGSKVQNYVINDAFGGYADFAVISVSQ